MGLKNRLNKMKSFLFDEVDEKENKVVKTKEKKKNHEEKKEEEIDNRYDFESEAEELNIEEINQDFDTTNVKSRSDKKENEFKFPEFDDDDFMAVKEEVKEEKVEKFEKPEKPARVPLYQGSKRMNETRKFKPSPRISPIFGLLDEDGNMVKKDPSVQSTVSSYKEEITYDDVRKKAYGIVEEELENTLKRLSTKTIEEAEQEMEEKEKKLVRSSDKKSKSTNESSKDDSDDDMILPNVSFKEIDIDDEVSNKKEAKKKIVDDDDDEETKEQDLFKLIDTMYEKEGKDD